MSEQQQVFWPKVSFNHLGQPRTPQPKQHLHNNQSRQFQTQPRRIQSTNYPSQRRITQEDELIQGLLEALGYCSTLSAFERENRRKRGQSNPQDSGKKSKISPQHSADFQERVHQIILESKNFQEMLQHLEQALGKEQAEHMQQQNQTSREYQSKHFRSLDEYGDLQTRIQQLFCRKAKVLLPIFASMEAQLDGKQIKLAALNGQNSVCILDSDHYLHVIRVEEGKSISVRVDSKWHPIDLRWINNDLILMLTSHTACFYQSKNLKVELSVRTDEQQAHCHEVFTVQNNLEIYIYILTSIQHKLVIRRLICRQSMLNLLPKIVFSGVEQLKYITVLVAPLVTERQMIAESEQDQRRLRYEQYYGLTHNQRSIVKFDTVVEKAGIFWKASSHFKIEELNASECREYLLLILSPRIQTEDEDQASRCHQNTLQYQIVKMNTKGCILEKVKYCLDCHDLPLGFFELEDKGSYISKILNISRPMHPSWLRCFSWNSQIYYFSLKSGRIIFNYLTNSKEQSIAIHAISSSNAVLYSTKRHLVLISTANCKPKKIQVEWHKKQSERQTMIQRLSRLQGIPENLLLILRSIRNNDLQLMELP